MRNKNFPAPNNTELINNSNECDWIEEAISIKLIKFNEFDQFYNLQEIGSGGFRKVYRADWKDSHKCCAFKSFYNLNDATIKAIVCEQACIIREFIVKVLSI
ncbi:unnamed protein product [Rhizophagus irregularis]|nr:unnamed protein product [Rhizophagus irregularis]